MSYFQDYVSLQDAANPDADQSDVPEHDITMRRLAFNSVARDVLPGAASYRCSCHQRRFEGWWPSQDNAMFWPADGSLHMPDCDVESNSRFRATLMEPKHGIANGVILLLHGLNEKRWEKYLPWALRLLQQTGKAVLLFPIAFHMDRTPAAWSDPRRMAKVCAERRAAFPSIVGSSLANAAMSSRLHMLPQRFFWSGLQTYEEIVGFIRELRAGAVDGLPADITVDFFAYSIGAFLSEILLMADEDGLFSASQLFLFCGGPTLDRMNPTSRYIIDSEATIALYSFFNEHLENEFNRDPRMAHYFKEEHPAGPAFRSMLSYHKLHDEREKRIRELAPRIRVAALRKDSVIPPGEILNTLQGSYRDIPVPVDVLDFPYDYSHVQPFPVNEALESEVDAAFSSVMNLAAGHLGQRT